MTSREIAVAARWTGAMSALNDAAAAAGFFSVLAGLAKQWVAVACLLTLAAALWIGCEVCDRKAARYLEEL